MPEASGKTGRAGTWDGTIRKGKDSTWNTMMGIIPGWKPLWVDTHKTAYNKIEESH